MKWSGLDFETLDKGLRIYGSGSRFKMVLGRSALIVLCHQTHTKANRIDVMLDRWACDDDLWLARRLMKESRVFEEIDGPNKDGTMPETRFRLFEPDEMRDKVLEAAKTTGPITKLKGEVYAMYSEHAFELELRRMELKERVEEARMFRQMESKERVKARTDNAIAILKYRIEQRNYGSALTYEYCYRLVSIQTRSIPDRFFRAVNKDYKEAYGGDGIVDRGSPNHFWHPGFKNGRGRYAARRDRRIRAS